MNRLLKLIIERLILDKDMAITLIRVGIKALERVVSQKVEHIKLIDTRYENLLNLRANLVQSQAEAQAILTSVKSSHPLVNTDIPSAQ